MPKPILDTIINKINSDHEQLKMPNKALATKLKCSVRTIQRARRSLLERGVSKSLLNKEEKIKALREKSFEELAVEACKLMLVNMISSGKPISSDLRAVTEFLKSRNSLGISTEEENLEIDMEGFEEIGKTIATRRVIRKTTESKVPI